MAGQLLLGLNQDVSSL
nr:hypothetical protein [Tanacetum cinerariifolium]